MGVGWRGFEGFCRRHVRSHPSSGFTLTSRHSAPLHHRTVHTHTHTHTRYTRSMLATCPPASTRPSTTGPGAQSSSRQRWGRPAAHVYCRGAQATVALRVSLPCTHSSLACMRARARTRHTHDTQSHHTVTPQTIILPPGVSNKTAVASGPITQMEVYPAGDEEAPTDEGEGLQGRGCSGRRLQGCARGRSARCYSATVTYTTA